jgi:L,D-peptidoglycan transpeptidase YkuD (ErfK/YbiS/YcfS/YnhG family)
MTRPTSPTTSVVVTTTTAATSPRPSPTAPPTPTPSATAAPAPPAPATGAQLIVVDAAGYGQSTAILTAYDQTATGWVRRFGPWTARIGRNGFAPPGAKREGDGRAPSGTYAFSFFFGIQPNPGVAFPYRRIDSTALVWDDDPNSANYNEWVDTRAASAGARPEPMYDAPFYDYGAVIAYNTARTPGLGSAIFLHVSNRDSTAGCVALPVSELLQVLRWLTPTRNPHVRMGVNAPRP